VSEPYEVLGQPSLHEPVLLIALDGWIDAGSAAAQAMGVFVDELNATPIVRFDADSFIDYRARRPTMQLRDGVMAGLTWPSTELHAGRDSDGNDVLLLTGSEPDSQWHRFVDLVETLAKGYGVRLAVGMGAYPFGAPHTRPSLIAGSASSSELAETAGLVRSTVDAPAGMAAVLEHRLAESSIPTLGLWVQVPHYAAAMAYPGAAVALVDTIRQLTGISVEAQPLRDAAVAHRQRLDELVAQSTEHLGLVHQLEEAFDAMLRPSDSMVRPGEPLPSGDELAAELERFLRDQGR
jgi:proteasome assembly chaperone (PAC2) family protein